MLTMPPELQPEVRASKRSNDLVLKRDELQASIGMRVNDILMTREMRGGKPVFGDLGEAIMYSWGDVKRVTDMLAPLIKEHYPKHVKNYDYALVDRKGNLVFTNRGKVLGIFGRHRIKLQK